MGLSLVPLGCASDASEPTTQCAEGADCSDLGAVSLTLLDVRYDLYEPVYVNNRIPVRFGLRAESADAAAPTTENVAVSFSLVEADPAEPGNPAGCASNAFNVELVRDGKEHIFNGFIWPTTVCAELVDRPMNLHVDFDGGELADTPVASRSVTFSEAQRDSSLNKLCRKDEAASAGDGCVYAISLTATPIDENGGLIDVRVAGMQASSSVALLPIDTTDRQPPTLVVQSTLVVNGRDPYMAPVAASEIPTELEQLEPGITEALRFDLDEASLGRLTQMPGAAWLRYEIAPSGTETYRPLLIGAERTEKASVSELLPGSPNMFDHELYAEGDTRAALNGEWADVDGFSVRGCFEADFTQAGNRGDIGADRSTAGQDDDCRVFDVVLVREQPSSSAALSFQFNAERSHSVGNDRIGMSAYFGTNNRLDKSGASSSVEGKVSIYGKLGTSFSFDVARAFGSAHLGTSTDSTGYELGVEVFGQSLLSFAREEASIVDEREFSVAKSFELPGLGFGFGPVKIGFKFTVGGEVFLNTTDRLSAIVDAEQCAELLGTTDTLVGCGELSRQITPGFAFTASIFGGLDLKLVKAGVQADLRLVETSFPLTASLAFAARDDGALLVRGNALWQRTLTLIKGKVSIVGKIGFKKWAKSLTVQLFSFSSDTTSSTLLEQSLADLEILN